VKAWFAYAVAALVLTLTGAGVALLLVPGESVGAVWFAAAVAYVVQLIAFAALIAVRHRHELFLIGWLAGLMLRFGVLGLVAFWLSRSEAFPLAPALISLVVFVFALLLLEPLFLRRGLQTK
jgi:hypothetical protein